MNGYRSNLKAILLCIQLVIYVKFHIAENEWNKIKVVPKNSSEIYQVTEMRNQFLECNWDCNSMDLILIKMMINIYGINSSTLNHYILSSKSLFSLVHLNNLWKSWNLKQCFATAPVWKAFARGTALCHFLYFVQLDFCYIMYNFPTSPHLWFDEFGKENTPRFRLIKQNEKKQIYQILCLMVLSKTH